MANRKEPYVSVNEIIKKVPTVASNSSSSNIAGVIVSPVGPRLAYVDSPVKFLELYTADGNTIPRNADITFVNAYYLSYFSGLVIARSLNTNALGGILVYNDNGTTKSKTLTIKDDVIMTKSSELVFSVNLGNNSVEPDWAFVMNDVVYYHGYEAVFTDSRYSKYTIFKSCESVEDFPAILENIDNVHVSSSSSVVTNGVKTLTITVLTTEDEDETNVFKCSEFESITVNYQSSSSQPEVASVDKDKWLFSIVGEVPMSNDSNKLSISVPSNYSDLHIFDLTLKNGTNESEVYRVSLDTEATENGVNMYIEYLNTQGIDFTVTVYKNSTSSVIPMTDLSNKEFGASGFSEADSKKDSNIFEALNYLAEQEIYDIEYLTTMGLTDLSITTRFQTIGTAHKWFCPIDIPYDCTTFTSVKRYVDNLIVGYGGSVDSEEVPAGIVLGPFERNSSLTGWYNYIAPSTLYYERIMSNKASSAEFAPVFKNDYGRFSYTNPTKLFKKTERTELLSLNKPVNWIVFDQRNDMYYLNDNRTFQLDQDNVVCEEQNARIVWKISKDVAKLLDKFIGKYNTRTTRSQVVDTISYYLDWNIMNKKFPPEDYLIQCDEYNNTDEIINANKLAVELKIRLYKAIKYVEVINKVFPLGVDFSTSI